MNKNLRRLAEPGKLPLILLVAFAAATLWYGMYTLAAIEGGAILLLMIFFFLSKRRREKQLRAYIESVTYETENAKSSTLTNFPLPIAVSERRFPIISLFGSWNSFPAWNQFTNCS